MSLLLFLSSPPLPPPFLLILLISSIFLLYLLFSLSPLSILLTPSFSSPVVILRYLSLFSSFFSLVPSLLSPLLVPPTPPRLCPSPPSLFCSSPPPCASSSLPPISPVPSPPPPQVMTALCVCGTSTVKHASRRSQPTGRRARRPSTTWPSTPPRPTSPPPEPTPSPGSTFRRGGEEEEAEDCGARDTDRHRDRERDRLVCSHTNSIQVCSGL